MQQYGTKITCSEVRSKQRRYLPSTDYPDGAGEQRRYLPSMDPSIYCSATIPSSLSSCSF